MARPKKNVSRKVTREDGWSNELTGLGTASRDKRLAATPTVENKLLTTKDCEYLWRASDIAARIVETPADEMVRKFPCIKIKDDKERGELLDAQLQTIALQETLRTGLRWARAFGGAAILLGVNDGRGLRGLQEPLDEKRIRSIDYLTVFNPDDCYAVEYYNNPFNKEKYGEPSVYEIVPRQFQGAASALLKSAIGPVRVHESRLIVLNGPITNMTQRVRDRGWGQSVLVRCYEVIRDFDMAWDSSAALLTDFAQAVFKMRGLADAIAGDAAGLVKKRMLAMDMSRSSVRSVLIDADGEEFSREQTPISGLAELLDRWCNRLASAARMPVTLLMGQSPAGLNATGDADIRWFYDQIASDQQTIVKPAVERLARLMMLLEGGEPDDWDLEFAPLWQLSRIEEADVYFKQAQGDMQYLQAGVVTPQEVANSRFGGDFYGMQIHLDEELRDQYATQRAAALGGAPMEGDGSGEGAGSPAGGLGAPVGVPTSAEASGPTPRDKASAAAEIADIVALVAEKKIPPESAQAILEIVHGMTPEQAQRIVATAGKGFTYEPPKPEPKPATKPAGGAK